MSKYHDDLSKLFVSLDRVTGLACSKLVKLKFSDFRITGKLVTLEKHEKQTLPKETQELFEAVFMERIGFGSDESHDQPVFRNDDTGKAYSASWGYDQIDEAEEAEADLENDSKDLTAEETVDTETVLGSEEETTSDDAPVEAVADEPVEEDAEEPADDSEPEAPAESDSEEDEK